MTTSSDPFSVSQSDPSRHEHYNLGVETDDKGNSATIQQHPPLPLGEQCRRINDRVERFLATEYGDGGGKFVKDGKRLRDVQGQVRDSLSVLREALERYSLDELSLSYNGGKDCLVLLILYLSALSSHFHKPRTTATATPNGPSSSSDLPSRKPPPDPSAFPSELNTVYIPPTHPIPAVSTFITSSIQTYSLSLSTHPSPMKSAFSTYLAAHPSIRAIFVGTRRTDPHGATLTPFDPTDRGWPSFMRVHPVVEWHYAEVWAFLRELEIPYCGVYDEGFTSLGGRGDTRPNPKLKIEGGGERYRPAYELVEDEEERLGRDN